MCTGTVFIYPVSMISLIYCNMTVEESKGPSFWLHLISISKSVHHSSSSHSSCINSSIHPTTTTATVQSSAVAAGIVNKRHKVVVSSDLGTFTAHNRITELQFHNSGIACLLLLRACVAALSRYRVARRLRAIDGREITRSKYISKRRRPTSQTDTHIPLS